MTASSISEAIQKARKELEYRYQGICRISIALYNEQDDTLKTFANSTEGKSPLSFYQAKLHDVPSLLELYLQKKPRIINQIQCLANSNSHHSQKIIEAGYQSSYTQPLLFGDKLLGFIFFDAKKSNFFTTEKCLQFATHAASFAAILAMQMTSIRTLDGALATAREFSRHRDEETGGHLERMANYSWLMAKHMATNQSITTELNEETVEFIFRFAPLHDIGKIAIPDHILLKPGKLNQDEYKIMQSHVEKGLEMIQQMVQGFSLDSIFQIDMLRNIVGCHHECYDGSGYPNQLSGADIPIEARIVAVADVFDALTSTRPYKPAWSFEQTYNYLKQGAGKQFDPVCVAAAMACYDDFLKVHKRYS